MRLSVPALALVAAWALLVSSAAHAAKPKPPLPPGRATVAAPVVVEWFSSPHARAGQHETVYAQLLQGKHPISGARLLVTVLQGKKVALRVHGGTTDRTGKAHASFVVPRSARGTTLSVFVSLQQGKQSVLGRANLPVLK